MTNFVAVWHSYSATEKRNIFLYIGGIMFYKLGLEFFNGSITTLASDRFAAAQTFTKLGAAQGVNQAAQCVGAILIAPLIKKWPTRTVLSAAILVFSLMTVILLIVDASTGGHLKPADSKTPIYGSWHPNLIFVIWTLSGVSYGMVELVRRVIPADIVGGDVSKLRRMDATVHVFYEIAGTSGAFASSSAISRWGNNYSFFLTPVFFVLAGIIWRIVGSLNFNAQNNSLENELRKDTKQNYLVQVYRGFTNFVESVYYGAILVLRHRHFVWLVPSYSLALYLHRFLESNLAPAFAKRVFGISAWSQIIVGGSNFGELLGALSVFLLSDYVTTPLPWLRADALLLNIVWILPLFATIVTPQVEWAWKIAACFIPISFGWAAGDVSLAAYIQSILSENSYARPGVSALGAVMAFLYSIYIVLNAIMSAVLGGVIDRDFKANDNIVSSLKRVGGIQFSVCCVIILLSTLVPNGALSLNPKTIGTGKANVAEETDESESTGKDSINEKKRPQDSV